MKLGIQVVLWIASIFFAYKIYDSINGPIQFNQVKNERYAKVIDRLKDIRKAQIAHKDVKGVFSNNFDSLVKFIDEGVFTLIEKRDSSYMEYDRTYRIDMLREVIVIDTLGYVPVKDSLFNNSESYRNFASVPVGGVDADFKIDDFDFYCHYNPDTGEVKSYIVSLRNQKVTIKKLNKTFNFGYNELIWTELSKKYDLLEIEQLANMANFKLNSNFLDCKHLFADSLWEK